MVHSVHRAGGALLVMLGVLMAGCQGATTQTPTVISSPSSSVPSPATSSASLPSSPSDQVPSTVHTSPSAQSATITTAALRPSGPVVARSGQRISGLRISTTKGPCVIVPANVSHVTIVGNQIGPCAAASPQVGILIQAKATAVTISGNRIHDVASGVYAVGAMHPIIFENNTVWNVLGPMPRGQMIQFDKVNGGSGQSRIVGNISDKNLATRTTHYEDHINMFSSSGSASAPILIACNKIRGGDSTSGSGIMTGDYGGGFIHVKNNAVVLTPNAGIGVVGGRNITVTGNAVYAAGATAASKTQVGVFVMGINSTPTDINIVGNRAIARSWLQGDGSTWGGYWSDGQAVRLDQHGNTWGDATLNAGVFSTRLPGC